MPETTFPNDATPPELRPRDILDGLQFWAVQTPDSPAFRFPSLDGDGSFKDLSWAQWLRAIEYLAPRLLSALDLADALEKGQSIVTLLIHPCQDLVVPWFALSSLGMTVQFISVLQPHDVVTMLLKASGSRRVLSSVLQDGIKGQVLSGFDGDDSKKPIKWLDLPKEWQLESLLSTLSSPQPSDAQAAGASTRALWSVKPSIFMFAHTFGSTSAPKLCPIPLAMVNMTAMGASMGWWREPTSSRPRVQLVTTLPFHLSFQSPVWKALVCGITVALPLLSDGPSESKATSTSVIPSASQVLSSLNGAEVNALYITPSALESVVLLTKADSSDPLKGKDALERLVGVCTVGAGVTEVQAKLFHEAGLTIIQSFGSSETGVLFVSRSTKGDDLRHLEPLPHAKPFMLFHPVKTEEDEQEGGAESSSDDKNLHELWLVKGFPALCPSALTYLPFPGDPSKLAHPTRDIFQLLPTPPDRGGGGEGLVKFVGRTDDRFLLSSTLPIGALEVEERLRASLIASLGFEKVVNAAAIGRGRREAYLVVQLRLRETLEKDTLLQALEEACEEADKALFGGKGIIRAHNVILTDDHLPIPTTSKGNLVRRRVEEIWAKELDEREKSSA